MSGRPDTQKKARLLAESTMATAGGQGGGSRRNGSAAKGSPSFSPVVRRIDPPTAPTESTPLVADSIDSWGLRGHYEMPSSSSAAAREGWRERLSSKSGHLETWNFPGWGSYDIQMSVSEETLRGVAAEMHRRERPKLREWEATAICANDILSSCLYVIGLVVSASGKIAPVALLLVSCFLYLLRFMYGEAISALPMNGGSYMILLNTTTKGFASLAATLALVSYIATGVVSATSAIAYLQRVATVPDPLIATILLLLAFALLVALGIKESARVAQAILALHIVTLTALCLLGAVYVANDPSTLRANFATPFPDVELQSGSIRCGSFATALLFGFASAILGVSGFESSSQFVQSQAPGVFVQTLRNMWYLVVLFNPTIAFLALGVLPLPAILQDETTVLAKMGRTVGDWASLESGQWLEAWISLDAFIVLSGALLTAYVGVSGLIERMASDRVLPQLLLRRNRWRDTPHNIIFGYFILSALLVVILHGDVEDLAGVYSIAFLSILFFFSIGVSLLKFKRPSLPRDAEAPWASVFLVFLLVSTGLMGNLLGNPEVLAVFVLYVAAAGALVLGMQHWARILQVVVAFLRRFVPGAPTGWLEQEVVATQGTPVVFFLKQDDVYVLNKAISYVSANEQTRHLIVVHVYDEGRPAPPALAEHVKMIDEMYPRIKVTLLNVCAAHFGPPLIEWLSRELKVPKNAMFLTAPDSTFKHKLDSLGGARIITH